MSPISKVGYRGKSFPTAETPLIPTLQNQHRQVNSLLYKVLSLISMCQSRNEGVREQHDITFAAHS